MAGESGPRSGKNAPKKKGGRKAIRTQAAWDKLSRRQQENLGGSRFKSTGGDTSSAKEAGHRDRDPGMDAGRRGG